MILIQNNNVIPILQSTFFNIYFTVKLENLRNCDVNHFFLSGIPLVGSVFGFRSHNPKSNFNNQSNSLTRKIFQKLKERAKNLKILDIFPEGIQINRSYFQINSISRVKT